ncbi:MAG: phage integrase N-terminal SAM-like domain-containing protein [Deltaproteobacteria bacterium]|nr:phage integrase N-terminal SAM-like domain-containing protein [Deltaproteobacteria bacterium]
MRPCPARKTFTGHWFCHCEESRNFGTRKYSYKTVKGYLYYNRDFLNFTGKNPSDINDSDIKDYLLYPALFKSARIYLAEEKQSATSTLNQAINPVRNLHTITHTEFGRHKRNSMLISNGVNALKFYPALLKSAGFIMAQC